MAQTGYTPILIYSSSTAAAAPAAGSLTNSTLGSELAINITDGKLFYKDNANAVQVIGWKVVPTTAGGTGLTSYAQGDLLYYNSGTTFTALAKNTTATRYLSNTGTNNNPAWAQINLANGVTGTLPTANGGTGLTSFTANGVVYASSTSALTTSSTLTFDGSTFLNAPFFKSISSANGLFDAVYTGTSTGNLLGLLRFYGSGSGVTGASEVIGALDTGSITSSHLRLTTTSSGVTNEQARLLSNGDFRLVSGNVVIATSGKGIDFSATAGTGTSELFADYEEGTFTPAMTSGSGGPITLSTATGQYTKIGNLVTFRLRVTVSNANSAGGAIKVTGLPFTCSSTIACRNRVISADVSNVTGSTMDSIGGTYVANATTDISILTSTFGNVTLTNTSSMDLTGTYFV